MKKILLIFFFFSCLNANSQKLENIFYKVLDEYINQEFPIYGLEKEDVILFAHVSNIEDGFLIHICAYEFANYPVTDKFYIYNNTKLIFECPEKYKSKFLKKLSIVNDNRTPFPESEIITIHESARNLTIQINKKMEIYIFTSHNDSNYYNSLREKIHFDKNVKFTKDLQHLNK